MNKDCIEVFSRSEAITKTKQKLTQNVMANFLNTGDVPFSRFRKVM